METENIVKTKSNKIDIYLMLVVAGVITIIDQLTKYLIAVNIAEKTAIPVIRNFFYIVHTTNSGIAWGLLEGQTTLLILITLVAFVLFGYIAKDVDFKHKKFLSFGIALMIGGAVGNFIDRVISGEVVDFLDFYFFGESFPVFNVADIALTIGMTCFAIDVLFFESKRESITNDKT